MAAAAIQGFHRAARTSAGVGNDGISTNIGVEATARAGWELGYHLLLAEDAMSSTSETAHKYSVTTILPRLGRVRPTAEILAALA